MISQSYSLILIYLRAIIIKYIMCIMIHNCYIPR